MRPGTDRASNDKARIMNRVEGYNLEAPSAELALSTYATAMGEDQARALWAQACAYCNIDHEPLNLDELGAVFAYLAGCEGIAGVFGKSLKVRLKAYVNIMRVRSKNASV